MISLIKYLHDILSPDIDAIIFIYIWIVQILFKYMQMSSVNLKLNSIEKNRNMLMIIYVCFL